MAASAELHAESGAAVDVREIRSPWDGTVAGEVRFADAARAESALARAADLHASRRPLPAHERSGILSRAAARVAAERDEYALGIALEGGKPLTDAYVEVDRAVNGLLLAAHEASHSTGPAVPMGGTPATAGRMTLTSREPIGPVVAISAFNHPLNLIVHQVAPAIAAGCPVIVKPASSTPLSCLRLVKALADSGLPPGWCVALPCDNDIASRLAADPRMAYLSFIGSAAVGWTLRSNLPAGARASLEHGGAAPLIVAPDADLETATGLILKGGYYHAGQVCVSVQRVFADYRVKEELADRVADGALSLSVGDPSEATTQLGPLIREAEAVRVLEWTREALSAGARLAAGGSRVGRQALEPVVLIDTPDSARAMRSEVFGPLVNIVGVDGAAEGVARANAVPWAFQAAVLTGDLETALTAARDLDATTVMVNDHTAFRADWMPFGGRGASGLGLGGIPYAFEEMTQPKVIVLRSGT